MAVRSTIAWNTELRLLTSVLKVLAMECLLSYVPYVDLGSKCAATKTQTLRLLYTNRQENEYGRK